MAWHRARSWLPGIFLQGASVTKGLRVGGARQHASPAPANGASGQPQQAVNMSGLRGLSTAGTAGLDTVRDRLECVARQSTHG